MLLLGGHLIKGGEDYRCLAMYVKRTRARLKRGVRFVFLFKAVMLNIAGICLNTHGP